MGKRGARERPRAVHSVAEGQQVVLVDLEEEETITPDDDDTVFEEEEEEDGDVSNIIDSPLEGDLVLRMASRGGASATDTCHESG
jgi:hypothetical protein